MKSNGGSAFPTTVNPDSYAGYGMGGMSLRDWFAGQALGLLAHQRYEEKAAARMAYLYADAMLVERERADKQ